MKKIMTLAVSAILALGLAACEDAEVEETPSGGDESSETVPGTGTTDTTGTTTEDTHPGYVICGNLYPTGKWDNEPDKTSDFYLSTASGETHWERTITGLAEDNGYCGFRVLTYGEWDSVCGASELTADSTGVSTKDNDILITDGVTYDLVIDISDTAKSIKVTEVVAEEPPETTTSTFTMAENEEAVVALADSTLYYWVDTGTNHVDVAEGAAYVTEDGAYHITYTIDEDVTPDPWGVQFFMELSESDKTALGLATGDEYTVSLSFCSTVSGSILINGKEVSVTAGETVSFNEVSQYKIGDTYSNFDEGTSSTITGTYPTLVIQAGTSSAGLLGATEKGASIEISEISFTKYVEEGEAYENLEAATNEAEVITKADGKLYYWADNYSAQENGYTTAITMDSARHYTESDSYEFTYHVSAGNVADEVWWGLQLFMELSAEELEALEATSGDYLTVSLVITSSVNGSVTICGNEITLVANVPYEFSMPSTSAIGSGKACFYFDAGTTSGGYLGDATITISGLSFEKYETPDEYPNSYVVDLTNVDSTAADTEEGNVPHDGHFYYWYDQNWCGSSVSVSKAAYDATAGGYEITYTSSGQCWFGFQLWMDLPDDSEFRSATAYKVALEATSTVSGNITLNKEVVTLVEGSNSFEVECVGTSGTTFQIQFGEADATGSNAGTSMISSITFVITSLVFYYN